MRSLQQYQNDKKIPMEVRAAYYMPGWELCMIPKIYTCESFDSEKKSLRMMPWYCPESQMRNSKFYGWSPDFKLTTYNSEFTDDAQNLRRSNSGFTDDAQNLRFTHMEIGKLRLYIYIYWPEFYGNRETKIIYIYIDQSLRMWSRVHTSGCET